MAFQATVPLLIMCGALTVAGSLTGKTWKKRQVLEHSKGWETGLRQVSGILPPRTHIDPFIAPLPAEFKDREIPIYQSGAYMSIIVPGGKLDPYANPYPSAEALEKERLRLVAYHKLSAEEVEEMRTTQEDTDREMAEKRANMQHYFRAVYRADPRAEMFRVLAYAKLHPELTLDQEKFDKTFDQKKLQHWH